ncbi:MAG TPA: helix-turn-helix domain-containing protein [Phycisphaerae bacterium]|nr:helix-turn-helix domain-containing protein [Phycisphaerae bacterium]
MMVTIAPEEKLALQPQTVAELLDISTRTLRRWVSSGYFPPHDFAHRQQKFYRRETVERWIAQQSPESVDLRTNERG